MAKPGKKYQAAASKIEDHPYELIEAITVIKDSAFAKFDETVEVHMRLGVDPRHADQMVRGTIVLPHGTGKTMRVAVIAGGEKIKEAACWAHVRRHFYDLEQAHSSPVAREALQRRNGLAGMIKRVRELAARAGEAR